MDWFKERIETATEALTAKRAFVVGSIFAIGTFVLHYIPKIPWGGSPMFLGMPGFAWGIIAALTATIYFLFEYAHRKRIELTPSIDVRFNPEAEGIVKTRTEIHDLRTGVKLRDDNAIYIRISIVCLSKAAVRGCVAFITKLERGTVQGANFVDLPLHGSIQLAPAPFDVYPLVQNVIDFLKVGEFDNLLGGSVDWPFRLDGVLKEEGTYRFTITVNAEGVSKNICVAIIWTGKWNAVTGHTVKA